MITPFAPCERAPHEIIRRQHETLAASPLVRELLDAIPNMTLILNEQRQIVYGNQAFANFLGMKAGEEAAEDGAERRLGGVLGQRPGEAVGCIRAHLTEGGCGTSLFCQTCGALLSILNSQRLQRLSVEECRMTRGAAGVSEGSLDLRVWSRPIKVEGEGFTVFSLMDISHEKRRAVLERIFFHDVLNTAGCVKGISDLICQADLSGTELREMSGMISESAGQLVEEILAQQELSAAETGELKPEVKSIESAELLAQVVRQFHLTEFTKSKTLRVAAGAEQFDFASDPVLLRRVLVNLVKNALEAERSNGAVTLNAKRQGGRAVFTVHNLAVMPLEIQRQVFMRSFTTKGAGRGLGTYSVRLITEKYLRRQVAFASTASEGTQFTVALPDVSQ